MTLVVAHRGASAAAAENTLPAFQRALELGVTTLEFDLQVTADRVLVVHHDQRVNRKICVHDDGSKVSKAPLKELPIEISREGVLQLFLCRGPRRSECYALNAGAVVDVKTAPLVVGPSIDSMIVCSFS